MLSVCLIAGWAACAQAAGTSSQSYLRLLSIRSAVSPTHSQSKTYTYGPDKVLDGRDDTSWQYSQKMTGGNGYRTYIILNLYEAAVVDTLRVKNGFWKVTDGIDQYWRNNRVKDAVISFQYQGSSSFTDPISYTFADAKQVTDIHLGGRNDVVAVMFQIDSVYKGERFDDVALTSMLLIGSDIGDTYHGSESDPVGDEPEIPYFPYQARFASLNQRMATRSGPNTKYTEPGTYQPSTDIRVFYQTSGNGVMWGMVEFYYGGKWYRAYTGMKRIDAGYVPDDNEAYIYKTMRSTQTPRYGPGEEYALHKNPFPAGASVKVYFQENGYAMADYEGGSLVVRGWVPLSSLK
jgi:hypothetical protein